MMSPFLRYTLLRITAFAVCLFVLWLIPPFRSNLLVLLFAAATVSMLISLRFLNGPRDEMSARIAERVDHRHEAEVGVHVGAGADADEAASGGRGTRRRHRASAEQEEDAEITADGERYR